MGVAFALLAERGALSLDHDVRTFLPEIPDFGTTVTLRHLLNHTSGYREAYGVLELDGRIADDDVLTRQDALDVVVRQEALQYAPGARYLHNSNKAG